MYFRKYVSIQYLSLLILGLNTSIVNASTQTADKPILLDYQSAFQNYRYFADSALDDWYQLNQTVDQIGGWRYYVQEPYKNPLNKQSGKVGNTSDQKQHHHHGGAK